MPNTSSHQASPRSMPARPNLEYLKNEAKRRLAAQRAKDADLKLSTVQFELAREYGFASWRALKTALEQPSAVHMEAAGDWIGRLPFGLRLALHVSVHGAVMDSPDYGSFGFAVQGFDTAGGHMTFSLPRSNGSFQGTWSDDVQAWCGTWRQDGVDHSLDFHKGVFPPAPTITGLDGIWEGLFDDQLARLVLRIGTDRHGTHGICDSPDHSGYNLPLQTIEREGNIVTFKIRKMVLTGTLDETGTALTATLTREDKTYSLTLHCREPGGAPLALPGVDLATDLLPRYTGEFGPPHWRVFIALGKDGLTAHFPNGDVVDMIPVSEGEFCFRRGVGRLLFDIEPDGSVSGLVFRLRGQDTPGKRYK